MKNKAKRNSENKSIDDHPLPVEEFARLVEGLGAADIEWACAQDGASPGCAPPAWGESQALDVCKKRAAKAGAPDAWPSATRSEWEETTARRIVARGDDLAAIEIRDGDQFSIDGDIEPLEGDLVVAEGPRGRLLRKLRIVGGAWLLCSGNPERPAIPLDDGLRVLGVALKAAFR